jgi:chitin disaccharide deacetylase
MIIVNADDFGFTVGVTDGIIKAYKDGIVTHTSIMANGLDFDRSIECAKNEVGLKVGVHLVATWGKPILRNNKKSTLINNQDGRFFTLKHLILRLIFGQIKKNDILIEWEEQIKKVYRAGIKIDHLNSHHHIHMLPGFNDVVYVLAKKYNIKSVRVTKEKVGKKDSAGVFIKKLIFIALDFFRGRNGVYNFHGLSLQSSKNYKNDLIAILKTMSDNSELMVHPGFVDNELLNEDIMNYSREHELKNIADYDVIKALKG